MDHLARSRFGDFTSHSIDPSTIPPSPSISAIQRLSSYESPPSKTPSPSRSSFLSQDARLAASPPPEIEVLPDIPDYQSKSSRPTAPSAPAGKAPSKLAMLASSRASAVSAQSSGSYSRGGTIKTFSDLRPTPDSIRSKELPPVPSVVSTDDNSSVNSSVVREAIENAMRLEEIDKIETPKRNRDLTQAEIVRANQDRTPSPTKQPSKLPSLLARAQSAASSRAQSVASGPSRSVVSARDQSVASAPPQSAASARAPSTASAPPPPPQTTTSASRPKSTVSSASGSSLKTLSSAKSNSTVKPLSKLALLAQQKLDASRAPKLPETTTEYLTPIANGSSVTTAITTSYQTLYSLTDPSRSNVIPRLNVVPLQAPGSLPPPKKSSTSPTTTKTSKLALKAKRAHERVQAPPPPPAAPEPEVIAPVLPIFQPSPIHARASPSAFATLLVDNATAPSEVASTKAASRLGSAAEKQEGSVRGGSHVGTESVKGSVISTADSTDSHPHRRRKLKAPAPPSVASSASSKRFAFDVPSPDDIVLQARSNTGLRKGAPPSSRSATQTSTSVVG